MLNNSHYNVIKIESSNHRELSMRNDMAPFTDPRVRQAIALTPGSAAMVHGAAEPATDSVGNDSPFAPKFPSTDTSVPQRTRTSPRPSSCCPPPVTRMASRTTLTTEQHEEIPALAQVIAQLGQDRRQDQPQGGDAGGLLRQVDVRKLRLAGRDMSLVEYGDRGVPNVFLEAPLESSGPWNAARFKNETYDGLVKQYVAAVDLQTQRSIAGKIEGYCSKETPLVIPYWVDGLNGDDRR